MPIPKPRKDEKKQDFLNRCMGDSVMTKDFPKPPQRAAVCIKQWTEDKKAARDPQ